MADEDDCIIDNEEELVPQDDRNDEASNQGNDGSTHNSTTYSTLTNDEIGKMRVPEMQKYLKEKYGMKSSNMKKTECVEQLRKAVQEKLPFVSSLDPSIVDNMANDDFFSPGAYWKELSPGEELNDDGLVVNGESFSAPTTDEGETIYVKKRNFTETFDQPPFIQEAKLPKRDENGKVVMEDGKFVYEKRNCDSTIPNIISSRLTNFLTTVLLHNGLTVFYPR